MIYPVLFAYCMFYFLVRGIAQKLGLVTVEAR